MLPNDVINNIVDVLHSQLFMVLTFQFKVQLKVESICVPMKKMAIQQNYLLFLVQ
jgi:hypothetical protein